MRHFFKILSAASLLLGADSMMLAGTITGQLQFPSAGQGIRNNTVTFTLTQPAVVAGTATVITAPWNCWTDTSGNLVGLPGDAAIAAPVLTSNLITGSLASGTYFVKYTWKNGTGESQPSAERNLVLSHSGTLIVQAPASLPAAATSMQVYIGTSPNGETLQGSVAVTGGVLAGNYSQSLPLVNGAAVPSSNTSACSIRFNDELTPSYTGYNVALFNASGAEVQGFRQKWYLAGGISGTINLSNGTPLYAGMVVYPQAIVSQPANNGQQSINGPLNLNGFGLTAGSGTISNAGTFSTGLQNDYLTSLLSSISPVTEYQAVQANTGNFSTEAIAGGAAVPSSSTMTQVNGIAGYVSHAGSSPTNAVGVYGQCRFLAANGHCWGGNLVFSDKGFVGTGTGLEIDANIANTSTTGAALQINGSFTGSPGSYPAIQIAAPQGGGKWIEGIAVQTGSTTIALDAGQVASGSSQPSQSIFMDAKDASGVTRQVQMQSTLNGMLNVTVPSGQGISVNSDGTFAHPVYNIQTDTGTGLCWLAAGIPCISGSGSILARFDSSSFHHVGTFDLGFISDTWLSRLTGGGILGVGKTSGADDAFIRSGNTVRVASDFTTANNTNLQTITGLSWTFPAVAKNWSFHCNLLYSQAGAAVSDTFGIQAATNAPSNIEANAIVYTASGTSTNGSQTAITTTTATSFATFTPSATASNFVAQLDGTLELPASANTINIMVSTSNGTDAITIRRGSYCSLQP